MTLQEEMERRFDPAHPYLPLELAHAALELAKHAWRGIETDNLNLHMGRDQKESLATAITNVGRKLCVVSETFPSAQEIEEFRRRLSSE